MAEIILKEESYEIIGICMEVHRQLGSGFKELGVPFEREKLYKIEYKGKILRHKYCADFVVYDSIILEVKATSFIVNRFVADTLNYLKASGLQLGIIANFGEPSFVSKRIVF